MKDELIWVDLNDNVVGYGEKLETHKRNILHRAFSVFLYSNGKMLIQQREKNKYHSGGLWANSCCSHPRKGEELIQAANRRVEEELGIKEGSLALKKIDSFVYFQSYGNLSEYEFDHIIVGEYDGDIVANPEEIEDYRWVEYEELAKELMEHPEQFSVWFLIAAPKVLRWLRSR